MPLEHLIILCTLFTNDSELQQEVKLALEQPQQYLQRFKNELEERGIEEPRRTLAWIALVNGLQRRNLLQELDWKEDPEELIALVGEFTETHSNQKEVHATLSNLEPMLNDDIEEFLPTINRAIEKHNIQLVWLDINSDSYPLTLLKLQDLKKARILADKIGFGKIIS